MNTDATAPEGMSTEWDADRWSRILDRIEHRDPGVGLRFWGPPLWLEVTMTGPDSASWAVAGASTLPERSYNWESATTCAEAMELCAQGASDDRLVVAAGRYTLHNMVLNATHEIGEWLRFDGQRLFPAHGGPRLPSGTYWEMAGDGPQGNGVVLVEMDHRPGRPEAPPGEPEGGRGVAARAQAVAAPWRFTAQPGMVVAYAPAGPVLDGDPVATPAGSWSTETMAAADGPEDAFVAAVQRDVHRTLLVVEADRVCRALHVDGRQAWRLTGAAPGDGLQVGLDISYDG